MKFHQQFFSAGPDSQSGAALATTMVFLVILTVIGVSTMQNNRLEQKMTTNLQELNHSFQYAESGLVRGLKAPTLLSTSNTGEIDPLLDYGDPDLPNAVATKPNIWLCNESGVPTTPEDCGASSNNGNAAVNTRYRGKGNLPPPNYSLESGFATHFFVVGSKGTSNLSASTHNVGLSVVGPGEL